MLQLRIEPDQARLCRTVPEVPKDLVLSSQFIKVSELHDTRTGVGVGLPRDDLHGPTEYFQANSVNAGSSRSILDPSNLEYHWQATSYT